MYRAVTLYCLENGLFLADGQIDTARLEREMDSIHISFRLNPQTGRPDTYLNGQNVEDRIRTMEVSARVSPVSALPFVRQALVARQQEMGREKGIVMDGRDIGTTVFPDAELKVFVTAAPEIRARRRYDELKAKGQPADYDDILANVKQRDDIDQHRPGQREAARRHRPAPGRQPLAPRRRRPAAGQRRDDHRGAEGLAISAIQKYFNEERKMKHEGFTLHTAMHNNAYGCAQ